MQPLGRPGIGTPVCTPPIEMVPLASAGAGFVGAASAANVEAAEIGPARGKSDMGDAVIGRRRPLHDLVRRGFSALAHILEVDAVLALIDDGNAPAPVSRRAQRQPREVDEPFAQRLEPDLQGS